MSLSAGPALLALGGSYEAKSQHCAAARCYLAVQKTPDAPDIQVLGALKLARLLISNFDNVTEAISALLTAVRVHQGAALVRGGPTRPPCLRRGLGHQGIAMSMVCDEPHSAKCVCEQFNAAFRSLFSPSHTCRRCTFVARDRHTCLWLARFRTALPIVTRWRAARTWRLKH